MADGVDARFTLGRSLVSEAGRIAMRHFRAHDLSIDSKAPGDLVTAADFEIERTLRRRIASRFQQDAVIGEELGGDASAGAFTWLIDPIDGTVNFARGIAYFCVSVALLRAGEPVAAWIFDPVLDELFWAGPDRIARLGRSPIHAANTSDLAEAVIGFGFSARHDRTLVARVIGGLLPTGIEFRRLGAGALCLAHVAAGRLDAYAEPHMNPWDAVGGLYIAACAGATTLRYPAGDNLAAGGVVFAANPGLAGRLLAHLPAPFSDTAPHPDNDGWGAGVTAA